MVHIVLIKLIVLHGSYCVNETYFIAWFLLSDNVTYCIASFHCVKITHALMKDSYSINVTHLKCMIQNS